MNKILITLFLTSNFLFGHSQSFSLTELINMTKMDIDNFDTYVSNKGYKFLEVNDTEHQKGNTYAFEQSSYSKKAAKFISFYYEYFGGTNKNVTVQTTMTAEYLKIKNQIKPSGFKFKETKTFEGSTFLVYTKEKYEISLVSFQSQTGSGAITSAYEISLTFKNE